MMEREGILYITFVTYAVSQLVSRRMLSPLPLCMFWVKRYVGSVTRVCHGSCAFLQEQQLLQMNKRLGGLGEDRGGRAEI